MSMDNILPLEDALVSAVFLIDHASKDEIQHALNSAVEMSNDLSVLHTRREIWKPLARLLRKQLKQY